MYSVGKHTHRWTSIDDGTDGSAMAFAVCCDAVEGAVGGHFLEEGGVSYNVGSGDGKLFELSCRKTGVHSSHSMSSAPQALSTGSRTRPQARKKPNDDASYFGPTGNSGATAGTKRQASDKADGEPRGKRKRAEPAPTSSRKDIAEAEERASLVRGVVASELPNP